MLIIEKGKTGEAQKKITTLESQVKTLREQASKVEAPAVVPENNGETVTETPTSEVPENVDTPMPELDLPLLE